MCLIVSQVARLQLLGLKQTKHRLDLLDEPLLAITGIVFSSGVDVGCDGAIVCTAGLGVACDEVGFAAGLGVAEEFGVDLLPGGRIRVSLCGVIVASSNETFLFRGNGICSSILTP